MSTVTVGQPLSGGEARDAIHVAIAPVVAACDLFPGQEVGFDQPGNTEMVSPAKEPIGIVDPFLSGRIAAGTRVWLFLFPNTITSLRHEWIHPAFGAESPAVDGGKADSEAWLKKFADDVEMSYLGLLGAAAAWKETGNYHRLGFDTPDRVYDDMPEFWRHYEVVTGEHVNEVDKCSFFSCSC